MNITTCGSICGRSKQDRGQPGPATLSPDRTRCRLPTEERVRDDLRDQVRWSKHEALRPLSQRASYEDWLPTLHPQRTPCVCLLRATGPHGSTRSLQDPVPEVIEVRDSIGFRPQQPNPSRRNGLIAEVDDLLLVVEYFNVTSSIDDPQHMPQLHINNGLIKVLEQVRDTFDDPIDPNVLIEGIGSGQEIIDTEGGAEEVRGPADGCGPPPPDGRHRVLAGTPSLMRTMGACRWYALCSLRRFWRVGQGPRRPRGLPAPALQPATHRRLREPLGVSRRSRVTPAVRPESIPRSPAYRRR